MPPLRLARRRRCQIVRGYSPGLANTPRSHLPQAPVPPNVAEVSSGAPRQPCHPRWPHFVGIEPAVPPNIAEPTSGASRRPCHPRKPYFREASSRPCHPTSLSLRRVPLDGPTGTPINCRGSTRGRYGAKRWIQATGSTHFVGRADLTHSYWPLRATGWWWLWPVLPRPRLPKWVTEVTRFELC